MIPATADHPVAEGAGQVFYPLVGLPRETCAVMRRALTCRSPRSSGRRGGGGDHSAPAILFERAACQASHTIPLSLTTFASSWRKAHRSALSALRKACRAVKRSGAGARETTKPHSASAMLGSLASSRRASASTRPCWLATILTRARRYSRPPNGTLAIGAWHTPISLALGSR